jgi:N-acetylmuramoyl-L-alanine amidase CwlA
VISALLTNRAYGYPTRGAPRRRKPTVLAVLHQTANAKAGPMDERNYANRAGSMGPSATAYVGRDGTVVRAIDPARYAAWSQGDVAHPDALAQAHMVPGVNFNELVYESVEVCGAGSQPFTAAQFEAVAQLLAAAHRAAGLPVDRVHVLAHADVNSVSRASDPWPSSTREAYMSRVITRANAILKPPITTVAVKSGDTLSGIAAAHGLTLAAILAFAENARYRSNPALIHPGDVVRVK